MAERTAASVGANWWWPLYAAVGACVVFLPLTVFGSDIEELLYIFVVAPIISIVSLAVLVVRKSSRQRSPALAAVVTYIAVTGALFKNYGELRPTLRWQLWSKHYKSDLLSSPEPASGDLKHIQWDGWGWGGSNTVAYLVFDPGDSLSAVGSRSSGKFRGIPCEVPVVRRLERGWYSVVFYTDTQWSQCP